MRILVARVVSSSAGLPAYVRTRVQTPFCPSIGLVAGVGMVIVPFAGGKMVIDGGISLGQVMQFAAYLVLYLEDGRIVEQDTHDEFVTPGGRYTHLHRRELLEEELEAA